MRTLIKTFSYLSATFIALVFTLFGAGQQAQNKEIASLLIPQAHADSCSNNPANVICGGGLYLCDSHGNVCTAIGGSGSGGCAADGGGSGSGSGCGG